MAHYTVCTPQYTKYYYEDGPETMADCVAVEAPTKRAARVLAVKEMRRQGMGWVGDQDSDKASPFTGLTVFDGKCEHGSCWCDLCTSKPGWSECPKCLDDWAAQDTELFL